MSELEKKAYSGWAFSEDSSKKRDINYEIYSDLLKKFRISRSMNRYNRETKQFVSINLDEYDVVIKPLGSSFATQSYQIIKNAPSLTADELALICDGGNLCFGYRENGNIIVVYTD